MRKDIKCEDCNRMVQTTSPVQVQTIPGSFDTKFVTINMCEACENEHNDLLEWAWNDAEQDRIEREMAEWGTPNIYQES